MPSIIAEVTRRHVESLANKTNPLNSHPVRRFATSLALPLLGGATILVTMVARHLLVPNVDAILTGLSIGTGLLFALVIFVFQLRLQVTSDPRLGQADQLKHNIDALFNNVLYGILVGLLGVSLAILTAMTSGLFQLILFATTCAVTLHWLAVVMLSLRRTLRAYQSLSR